jgi:hypothetical protein
MVFLHLLYFKLQNGDRIITKTELGGMLAREAEAKLRGCA